jgi:hypothetical protein
MQMLLITVTGLQRSADLQVPGELALSELLPTLLEICYPSTEATSTRSDLTWRVVYGQASLLPDYSLLESGVLDGAVLVLQNAAAPILRSRPSEQKPQQFVPRSVSPDRGTGGIGVRWSKDGFGNEE